MTALVDVFEASLDCEVTTIKMTNYSYKPNPLPESGSQYISSPGITTVKSSSAYAMKSPLCPNTFEISFTGSRSFVYNGSVCGGDSKSEKLDRFIALFGDVDGYGGMKPKLGLACAPSYSIRKASVTLNKTASGQFMPSSISFLDGTKTPSRQSSGTLLDGITSWDILYEFVRTMVETRSPLSQGIDALFDQVVSRGHANDRKAGLSRLFSLVTAQIANRNLKAPAQTPLVGTAIAKEDRLMVSPVSFWILGSLLVLLCFSAGLLILLSPQAVIPCDTSTIAGLAAVLARNSSAISQLEGTGQASNKSLTQLLKTSEFRTNTVTTDDGKSVFLIERKSPSPSEEDTSDVILTPRNKPEETTLPASKRRRAGQLLPVPFHGARNLFRKGPASPIYKQVNQPSLEEIREEKGNYKPFTVTVAGRVLILIALLALIITLELLYQHSTRNDGLAEINNDDSSSSSAHYAWRYVPTAVMVGMSLWLGTLSSTIKLLSPYHSLWRGRAPAEKSITENYLTSVAIVSIWHAAKNQKWGVATAGVASMLASTLTVVASGLLFTETSVTNAAVEFQIVDSFNMSRVDEAAGLRFASFILASNLSDPV